MTRGGVHFFPFPFFLLILKILVYKVDFGQYTVWKFSLCYRFIMKAEDLKS